MHLKLATTHFIFGFCILYYSYHECQQIWDFCCETILASGQYLFLWFLMHCCFQCDIVTKIHVCKIQITLWNLLFGLYGILFSFNTNQNEKMCKELPLYIFFNLNLMIIIFCYIYFFLHLFIHCLLHY